MAFKPFRKKQALDSPHCAPLYLGNDGSTCNILVSKISYIYNYYPHQKLYIELQTTRLCFIELRLRALKFFHM
jgi:hypothetical protein